MIYFKALSWKCIDGLFFADYLLGSVQEETGCTVSFEVNWVL